MEYLHLLKEFISIILTPWTMGFIISLLSLLFLLLKQYKRATKYLTISIVWMLLISSSTLGDLMIKPLESSYVKLEQAPKNIKYILLLGGEKERRAWEALRVHKLLPDSTIITSGFTEFDKISYAEKTANMLIDAGIKKEQIKMFTQTKTTSDEAQEMKKLVGEAPFILITAAYHMPRAMMLFKKSGLNPIPAPADFYNFNENASISVLHRKHLKNVEYAWHEYLGLVLYKLQGKI